jgi:hypothetical protein
MAKFIQEFYSFLSFCEGKDIASKRPPEKIDEALYFVIVDEFTKWLDHYVKTKKIEEILGQFKRRADITLTGGVGILPPDYALYRTIMKSDGKTRIDYVEDLYWSDRMNSSIAKVTEAEPICRIDYTKGVTPVRRLEVFPNTITTCELQYFKNPTKPKYAYDVQGTKYVYNDTNSIDIEFSIMNYPNLPYRVGQMVSINIRENQLYQFMQAGINQEQRK